MSTELDTMSTDDLLRFATAAFVAMLDGGRSHEFPYMAGLPESDCERIAEVHGEIIKRIGHFTLRLPELSDK